jgi:predicted dehydrogenase
MPYSPDAAPISAAIIGAGAAGGYHVKAQMELGSRVTIYEPNETCAKRVADTYGVIVARTMEEAVAGADVVHICTPPMNHRDSALASIALGKPTIIEKPLTHNLDEAVDIYRAAAASGVPVLVGKHFRLTPPFLAIHEGMRRGDIGPITSVESTYVHDMGKLTVGAGWRKGLGGNGFMYEGAAHPVDLNVWLAAQPVREVQATISERKIRPEYRWAEDLTLTLVYEDGTVGRVWSNASAPLPRHGASVAVYGSTGAYRAHNKHPELQSYTDGDADWVTTETAEIGQTIRPMAALFHEYIRGERADFAPMPGIEEALGVMVVLNTLETAAESGCTERVPTVQEVCSGRVL